jgi:hypothetical protein
MTVSHLMQLYTRLTAQPLQHAGLAAVTWLAGVRSYSAALLSVSGVAPAAVCSAMTHLCASIVSLAADPPIGGAAMGPFSSAFLLKFLELLMQGLLSLRALCAGVHHDQHLNGGVMQAWRDGLQAQAHSREGQAVAKALAFL